MFYRAKLGTVLLLRQFGELTSGLLSLLAAFVPYSLFGRYFTVLAVYPIHRTVLKVCDFNAQSSDQTSPLVSRVCVCASLVRPFFFCVLSHQDVRS